MEALLVVCLLAGFITALASIVLVGLRSSPRPAFAFQPPQGYSIPLRRRTMLFSKAERALYQGLRSLVPDHMIFVKVRLADLISVKPSRSFWEHFSPINRKHIDFVICDPTLAPVVAIELDPVNPLTAPAAGGDLLTSVLASAALPIVHIPQKRRYLFNDLRRLLAPYLAVPRPLL
jgi:Protein of unknown function (DUF2726)